MYRVARLAGGVAGLVLMLWVGWSWGQAPPNNDTSLNGNTAGGTSPTALGLNTIGTNNTAFGSGALSGNATGSRNIAIGAGAGSFLTNGDRNIYLGNAGGATESTTVRLGDATTRTFIAGIVGASVSNSAPVLIDT